MKKIISLISLFAILFMFSSCKITQEGLWGAKIDDGEVVKDLLINNDKTKLIIVGNKYTYFLSDKEKKIQRLLLWDRKEKLEIGFIITAKGSEVEVDVSTQAPIKTLSKKQIEFLKSLGGKERNHESWRTKEFLDIVLPRMIFIGTRQGSNKPLSQNQTDEFVSTSLVKSEDKTSIFEDRTPSQTFGKILLTPFAVAADIVLSPLYFVTIMWVAIAARHDGHISDAKK